MSKASSRFPDLIALVPCETGAKPDGTQSRGGDAEVPQGKPGTPMADGSLYVGISPDTGKPLYVMPIDVPAARSWLELEPYASAREGWRLPTIAELTLLYEHRQHLGGFFEDRWYWSQTRGWRFDEVWGMTFAQGNCASLNIHGRCRARLVKTDDVAQPNAAIVTSPCNAGGVFLLLD